MTQYKPPQLSAAFRPFRPSINDSLKVPCNEALRLMTTRLTAQILILITVSLAIGLLAAGPARAVAIPTIEDFNTDVANWGDASDAALLTHVASGGPDGSGYASTQLAFAGLSGGAGGESVVLFRAEDEFISSGNAFVGNWLADGITRITAQVRHDAPVPLNYFGRFARPANFPAAGAVQFAPVPPGQWTTLEFDLRITSPQIVTFEGSNYGTVFSNIGHVQFGVEIPMALANEATAYTFDLDQVVATPEPSALVAATGALLVSLLSRRRRCR